MKKALLLMSTIMLVTLFLVQCDPGEKTTDAAGTSDFHAVEISSTLPFGTAFPTDSNIINSWVANSTIDGKNLETNEDIIKHGWAIWSGLTHITDEEDNGQKLRTFETWYTPQDVINALDAQQENPNTTLKDHARKHTGLLGEPNQFHGNQPETDVTAFVKYNPYAAQFAYDNKLFYKETLDSYYKPGGIGRTPDFPAGAITLKPVFEVLNVAGDMHEIDAWQGEENNSNKTASPNIPIKISLTQPTDRGNNIFNIEEFIYFKLDSVQAAGYNNIMSESNGAVNAGDYAVLLAIHVTSREIKRWTWQTFWWSLNPDKPHEPSSERIASFRGGADLEGGANNYAMSVAYSMVSPAQPYYRSQVTDPTFASTQSIYAYNPYLEAGFNQAVFKDTVPSIKPRVKGSGGYPYFTENNYSTTIGGKQNDWGMQTNCMSCHGQARYYKNPPTPKRTGQRYVADVYVGLNDKYFVNTVAIDFAWSIASNAKFKEKSKRRKD